MKLIRDLPAMSARTLALMAAGRGGECEPGD